MTFPGTRSIHIWLYCIYISANCHKNIANTTHSVKNIIDQREYNIFSKKNIYDLYIYGESIDQICLNSFWQWEKDGGGVPTAVECYMKEYGVTVQEAKKALRCLVEEQWRSINQEFLRNTTVPVPLLTRVINLARLMETLYKTTNGYRHCSGVTDLISNVLDTCVPH